MQAAARRSPSDEQVSAEETHPPPRRRGPIRIQAKGDTGVLEAMVARPRRLSTLPPDGTVLEDLIGDMQSEYGVPTTPQEYRLIIKTPAHEEATDPSLEVQPVQRAPQPGPEPESSQDARSNRRRRRTRRRGSPGIPAGADAGDDEDGPLPGPTVTPTSAEEDGDEAGV